MLLKRKYQIISVTLLIVLIHFSRIILQTLQHYSLNNRHSSLPYIVSLSVYLWNCFNTQDLPKSSTRLKIGRPLQCLRISRWRWLREQDLFNWKCSVLWETNHWLVASDNVGLIIYDKIIQITAYTSNHYLLTTRFTIYYVKYIYR